MQVHPKSKPLLFVLTHFFIHTIATPQFWIAKILRSLLMYHKKRSTYVLLTMISPPNLALRSLSIVCVLCVEYKYRYGFNGQEKTDEIKGWEQRELYRFVIKIRYNFANTKCRYNMKIVQRGKAEIELYWMCNRYKLIIEFWLSIGIIRNT